MAKAIRNLSVFNKIDVTRSIRNIFSQEFHSALGKISIVNFMYSLGENGVNVEKIFLFAIFLVVFIFS